MAEHTYLGMNVGWSNGKLAQIVHMKNIECMYYILPLGNWQASRSISTCNDLFQKIQLLKLTIIDAECL